MEQKPYADLQAGAKVHVIGIGGAGMSAIATVLLERGYRVSGSDRIESNTTQLLSERGAQVFIGHDAQNIGDATVVLMSSAIKDDNEEVLAAQQRGISIYKRAEFLGWLTNGSTSVAVSGTHGKTTTTAMVAAILMRAGRDPSFIVGGTIHSSDANRAARAGQGAEFVIEADEYDYMFLGLTPHVAVVTNLEHDHPDCFPTFESMRDAFRQFVAKVSQDGLLVICGDDMGSRALADFSRAPWITYGLGDNTTWRATDLRPNNVGGGDFVVLREGQTVGVVRLRVPGQHNTLNALAAIAATNFLGVSFEDACDALREFRGVQRRFEMRGESRGVAVIDDYGHHPTEIRATLAAARMVYPTRTIWAVWQPHTFSRTRLLADKFATAFDDANHVIATKIYASREKDIPGINAAAVVARMRHPDARYVESLDEVVEVLTAEVQPNDVVITLSAGDATQISDRLLEHLKS